MKFELDLLLEWWAEWSAKREDNGVDGDGIASVMDRAICRLNPNRKQVVEAEYRRIGTQYSKSKALGITQKAYERRLANARLNLMADVAVKKLLKRY